MLRFSKSKVIAIVATVLIGFLLAVPSMLTPEQRQAMQNAVPRWLPSWIVPTQAIVLGLDLQGGSHVLLEVDVPDFLRSQANQLRDDVRRILRETRVAPQGGSSSTQRGVQIRVADPADRERVLPKLRELAQPVSNPILGQTGNADLQITEQPDGTIQLAYTEAGMNERVRRASGQAIEVLRRRVDALGTTEPNIQRQGADRILVQVPGLQDPQRLKDILGRTAKLEFRLVANEAAGDVDLPPSKDANGQRIPVERRVIVEGGDLIDAQPAFDQRTNQPIVNFRFNIRGAQRFGQVTSENVGRPLAIVLDNEVISSPVIQSPITGGSGQLRPVHGQAGQRSRRAAPRRRLPGEAHDRRGAHGRTGSRRRLHRGKLALLIGTILVAAFMIASYGLLGVLAVVAVFINVGLIFGVLSVLGATLTLPGIAGILLTIGSGCVDSNVIIYERIREEARLGRTAIVPQRGLRGALGTILDATSTTLAAGSCSSSALARCAAVTLSIGIITTVFTAYTVTRLLIATWYRFAKPVNVSFS